MGKKKIHKFVLTGGPSGGKTTGLNTLVEELTNRGYKVLVVPEAATEIFLAGTIIGENGITNNQFQSAILKYQLYREEFYEDMAEFYPHEKIVIICDRGAFDNKAYCTKEEFSSILAEQKLSEVEIRDRYDGVFHLVTAANGAEEFYTTENNVARKESSEEARALDAKLIDSWTGHPHLRIIDNSTDFKTKINRLLKEILQMLGEPAGIEIESKYVVEMPNIEELLHKFGATKVDILQYYLIPENEGEELRLRQRGIDGGYIYVLTKKRGRGKSRIETEKRIPHQKFLELLMRVDTSLRPIRKVRYCFVYKNLYFELDVYPFWNKQAILEIELSSEDQSIELPDFIKVVREVTEDDSYKNYQIAREIPEEIVA